MEFLGLKFEVDRVRLILGALLFVLLIGVIVGIFYIERVRDERRLELLRAKQILTDDEKAFLTRNAGGEGAILTAEEKGQLMKMPARGPVLSDDEKRAILEGKKQ